jgi:protein-tyrosine phosphatase
MTSPTSATPPSGADLGDERFVALESVFNLRDLGGLTAMDGRKVRTGLVYRSDQFGNASQADVDQLVTELGFKTVVDLRRPDEIKATASFPQREGVTVHNIEFGHLRWEAFEYEVDDDPQASVTFLTQRYTAMIETGAAAIKDTLDLMCDATPLVFHCMAGKDRTGITAAVTLGLLGVSAADIAADYALTSYGLSRYYAWREASGHAVDRPGLSPAAEAMDGLLHNIDSYFGSVEAYARTIGFRRIDDLRATLLD